MNKSKTVSLIIETENLGMAGFDDLCASLDSISPQIKKHKQVIETILVVGSHLSQKLQKQINSSYPWVKIVIEENGLEYTESKMFGAKKAKGEFLIFADSDMKYEESWLSSMIKAINKVDSQTIISGDTRLESDSSYKFSLNTMWMVQINTDKIKDLTPYRHFPLNNFAINRKILLETPIPHKLELYRNKIPVWQQILDNKNYKVLRAPKTRGFHAPPNKFMDWFYRMLIYGSNFVAFADFFVDKDNNIKTKDNKGGRVYRFALLIAWKLEQIIVNTYKLLREDIKRLKYVPLATLISFVNLAVIIIGGAIAIFDRKYVFNKVEKYEASNT